jgi:hypothetical protein
LEGSVRAGYHLLRFLRWLLVPESIAKLLIRHAIALVVFWVVQRLWQKLIRDVFQRCAESLSKVFGNASYNRERARLLSIMDTAASYDEWGRAASDLDRLEGRYAWKEDWRSTYYDFRRIKQDLLIFRQMVDTQDVQPHRTGYRPHTRSAGLEIERSEQRECQCIEWRSKG